MSVSSTTSPLSTCDENGIDDIALSSQVGWSQLLSRIACQIAPNYYSCVNRGFAAERRARAATSVAGMAKPYRPIAHACRLLTRVRQLRCHSQARPHCTFQAAGALPVVGVLTGKEDTLSQRLLHVGQDAGALITDWCPHDGARELVTGPAVRQLLQPG